MDQRHLVKKLISFRKGDAKSLRRFNTDLKHIFLVMGSKTEENLNCTAHIEYGLADKSQSGLKPFYGLKVKGKNLLLSHVMNTIENLDLPSEIKEEFPDLTTDEWDAATRMITMVLLSLECESSSHKTRESL